MRANPEDHALFLIRNHGVETAEEYAIVAAEFSAYPTYWRRVLATVRVAASDAENETTSRSA